MIANSFVRRLLTCLGILAVLIPSVFADELRDLPDNNLSYPPAAGLFFGIWMKVSLDLDYCPLLSYAAAHAYIMRQGPDLSPARERRNG